jgi:hypothetical protein
LIFSTENGQVEMETVGQARQKRDAVHNVEQKSVIWKATSTLKPVVFYRDKQHFLRKPKSP